MSILIKQAVYEDLELIQKVGRQSYIDHFSTIWTRQGVETFLNGSFSDEQLRHSLDDNNQFWFLYMQSPEKCIGIAKVHLNEYEPNIKCEGAELEKIYFLREAVGQGYAKKFIQFILDFAEERDQKSMYLSVLKSNVRAQRFYEYHGFVYKADVPYSTDLYDIGMNIMKFDYCNQN
ncbi:GNAT family N-acetyltransferase [Acinetobacter nectaris]|uniref:GNAT family N-acetyltransferase n=1 Tax=Acinetobacter nectaris TaxID=1219382 RepID=UPI001F438F9A|nr:GNAT family N-acetyltransferase [Acinetobacter nectaris]MCF9046396.1 GNAT family N-acetyltransferase [Acinetobacter nectaris]